MRVSTNSLFRNGEQTILEQQSALLTAQTRLSSGKRIGTPADDPLGAADVVAIRNSLSQFGQFKDNQNYARYLLNLGESALEQVVSAVQDTQEKLVQGAGGALGNAERGIIASNLDGILGRMVGLANSGDGAGGYLFAGSREGVQPFVQGGTQVSFYGDDVLQSLEVSKARYQQVKYSGDALFLKIRPGNGTFTTVATGSNTGTGWINAGSVTSPSALTGRPYTVRFTVAGGATSYVVERSELVGGPTVVASGAYSGPQELNFDGINVSIDGAPANGDTFTVAPSGFQSLFDTMAQAIATLRQPVQGSPAAYAQFKTAMANVQASVGQVLDHLSIKRADIGTALSELDAYEQLNDDRQVEYESRLSSVEDLDFVKGASELSRRQMAFEAALKSYTAVSRLTLFDYL